MTGLRVLVLVVRVRCRRSRREVRAEMQWRRVQVGGWRGQWERRGQGVEMSENWEELGAISVLGFRRKGVRVILTGDGDGGVLVAFALINGGCWTCRT